MKTLTDEDALFAAGYVSGLANVLSEIDPRSIAALLSELRTVRDRGTFAWFFGNGGKAAIAAEFANDLSGGVDHRFRGISLSSNVPMLTALANDHDYAEIYSRQIAIYARPGDLCVGMSGSGHSLNVLDGLREAYCKGIRTVGLVGMDGGRMLTDYRKYIDALVHIPCPDDGPIEDAMLAICHLCVMKFRAE
jgi:phosphoheptose isomerase